VRLLLASTSPRRRDLLAAAGFVFDVDAVDVDERQLAAEAPATYVERLARLKAETSAVRHPARPVVGADTTVVLDADVLGKPADNREAAHMLRRLSGREHKVLTGVALVWQGRTYVEVVQTIVRMDELSDADIADYVASGEPAGKAGAYAIQGRAARFIPHIEGSFTNVVGLPVATVLQLLRGAGVPGIV
jgi:septum formation protein